MKNDFKLQGTSGCLLGIGMLLITPGMVFFDAFILQKIYNLLILQAMPSLPSVPYLAFLGVVGLKIIFLWPVTSRLGQTPLKESQVEKVENNPIRTYISDILSSVLGKLLYLAISWVISIIVF